MAASWKKDLLDFGRQHAGVQKRRRNNTFLLLGESQVRSAPRLPLRRSAPCPHLRVQPHPGFLAVAKLSDGLFPWPDVRRMQGRSSHHPRALSGRGEKPIRGSEERELSSLISPPEPRLPVPSHSSSLRPPSTTIQGSCKVKAEAWSSMMF